MAIVSSGAISLGTTAGTDRSISGEFGGTTPHGLSEYYRDGSYSDGINIPSGETGIPASGAIAFSDFYGTSNVSATTYYSSISAESYSSDSAVIASSDLRVFYLNGNIDVRAIGGDTQSPSSGTTVYRISGAPSGYTVRTTVPSFSGDIPSMSGSTIGTTATSIPTFSSFVDREFALDSGGGYDDPGSALTTITGSLIFEKSGSTTFTYSYSISLEAENAGEGGQ
jgi:hypothetical protein